MITIVIWALGIFAVLFLLVLLAFPFIISYQMACEYAQTLPEEEQEKFWSEYMFEISKDSDQFKI